MLTTTLHLSRLPTEQKKPDKKMILEQLDKAKLALLDLVFPRRCLGCGSGEDFLCAKCCASLPRIVPPICRRCGAPLKTGDLCARCQEAKPDLDGIRSLVRFEGLARQAIHSLKYRHFKALAGPLGALLADYLEGNPLPADVIMPVPLHPRRLRERGYNQSALVAQELSRRTGITFVESALLKTKYTPPQARSTDATERRSNVQGAFVYKGASLAGKHVLLVDDVCTTGATLEACASPLKAQGTASVWALTLAREV